MKEAERDLLKFSDLHPSQIQTKKVYLDDGGQNWITTFIVGDSTKPKMVLVHGYGGSGALLYRLFKHLIQDF